MEVFTPPHLPYFHGIDLLRIYCVIDNLVSDHHRQQGYENFVMEPIEVWVGSGGSSVS